MAEQESPDESPERSGSKRSLRATGSERRRPVDCCMPEAVLMQAQYRATASLPASEASKGLYRWVASGGKREFPSNMIEGGHEADKILYVGRAAMFGDILPGKIVREVKTCYVPYGGAEHASTEFEALVVDENAVFEWVAAKGGEVPEGAVEGGVTDNGEKLYVGRAPHLNMVTNGKVHPSHKTCYIPHDGIEHHFDAYEVLVVKRRT